jgi:hypothetical protein
VSNTKLAVNEVSKAVDLVAHGNPNGAPRRRYRRRSAGRPPWYQCGASLRKAADIRAVNSGVVDEKEGADAWTDALYASALAKPR